MVTNITTSNLIQPHRAGTAPASIDLTLPASRFLSRITKLDDASLSYPSGLDHTLISLEADSYQPFWHRIERSSSFGGIDLAGRAAGVLDFDIDLYRYGASPVSFNVKCMLLVTPHESKSDMLENLSHAAISRMNEGQQWVEMQSLRSSNQTFDHNIIKIMQQLFLGSLSSQAPLIAAGPQIPTKDFELSKKEFWQIISNTAPQEDDDLEILRSELRIHFARFPFPDAIRDYIERGRIDIGMVSAALEILMDEATHRESYGASDYILHLASSHPKPSIRYAAVEALSHHLDERIRNVLAVRLRDESNKTVASSLSAALG